MNKFFKLVVVSFFGLSTVFCSAQSSFEQGVNFFDKRAEKHEGLIVDSTNINLAIKHFKNSLKDKTKNEEATDYLLLCYYYKAAFVVRNKEEQKKNYFIGQTLGRTAIKKYPKNNGILLWYIANMSKYGEAKGIVSSAKKWVSR